MPLGQRPASISTAADHGGLPYGKPLPAPFWYPNGTMARYVFIACLMAVSFLGDAHAEMAVEVVQVFYRNAAELVPELSKNLSDDGRLVADPKSNSLIMRDRPQNIAAIKEKLKALDKMPRRVRITVGFVEREAVDRIGSGVRWFLTVGDWSQGNLPADMEVISGFNATPLGMATKRLETFSRQLILLEGDRDGTIYVSHKLADSLWFSSYGVMNGYIDTSAQFRDFGASFSVSSKVEEAGRIEVRLVPKLTRLDGGSDIPLSKAYVFMVVDGGQSILLSGNVEKGDSFGKRFLTSFMGNGGKKELVMVLGAFVE